MSRRQAAQSVDDYTLTAGDIARSYIHTRLRYPPYLTLYTRYEAAVNSILDIHNIPIEYLSQYSDAFMIIGKRQLDTSDIRKITDFGDRSTGVSPDTVARALGVLILQVFPDGKGSWSRIVGIMDTLFAVATANLCEDGNLHLIERVVDSWHSSFNGMDIGPFNLTLNDWLIEFGGWDDVLTEARRQRSLPIQKFEKRALTPVGYVPFQSMNATSKHPASMAPVCPKTNPFIQTATAHGLGASPTAGPPADNCSCGRPKNKKGSSETFAQCPCGRFYCTALLCTGESVRQYDLYTHYKSFHENRAALATCSKCNTPKVIGYGTSMRCPRCANVYWCLVESCVAEYESIVGLRKHQTKTHMLGPHTVAIDLCERNFCGEPKKRDGTEAHSVCQLCGILWCLVGKCPKEFVAKDRLDAHISSDHA